MYDPFLVLDIPESADDARVRAAYRALIAKHPPDKDPAAFRRISAAYERIKTEELRAEHFLLAGAAPGVKIQDLIPPSAAEPKPVGVETWLNLVREAADCDL